VLHVNIRLKEPETTSPVVIQTSKRKQKLQKVSVSQKGLGIGSTVLQNIYNDLPDRHSLEVKGTFKSIERKGGQKNASSRERKDWSSDSLAYLTLKEKNPTRTRFLIWPAQNVPQRQGNLLQSGTWYKHRKKESNQAHPVRYLPTAHNQLNFRIEASKGLVFALFAMCC